MRRPLYDLPRIQERLDIVEALCGSHTVRQVLHDDLLRRVPDISLLGRRLTQKKASLQVFFLNIIYNAFYKKINLGLLSSLPINSSFVTFSINY